MSLGTIGRAVATVLLVLAAAYWLLADTVRRYVPEPASAGEEIRFSYWGGFADHRMWQEVIAAFEAREPDLHVRPLWLPLSGYNTKLDHQLVAGIAPDVMMFQDEPFPRYAAEQFAPLDEFITADAETRGRLEDCWPTAVESFRHGGSLRGIPIIGGNVLIYCNLDAFARAERVRGREIPIPAQGWTLGGFLETCRLLTVDVDDDGDTDQFGFLQPHWVYYLPFIWAHGASLLDESRTRWTLVGPEAVSAFRYYADLRHRWKVTPRPIEYAGQNSDTAFLSGRVAMCVNGPWFQPFLRETTMSDRYRVVPIPRGPGGGATRVTWDALCIYGGMARSRQEKAWRFVRFVLTREAQEVFARYQRAIPARQACADDYVRYGGGEDSTAAAFVEAMETARLQPITPSWGAMHRAMRRHLTSVILEGAVRRRPVDAIAELAKSRMKDEG